SGSLPSTRYSFLHSGFERSLWCPTLSAHSEGSPVRGGRGQRRDCSDTWCPDHPAKIVRSTGNAAKDGSSLLPASSWEDSDLSHIGAAPCHILPPVAWRIPLPLIPDTAC